MTVTAWYSAFICGGQVGGTFSMGLQRLQGTVAGVLAGFFIIRVAHEEPYATTALIAVWVLLSAYVRTGARSAYPGLTACYMGASAALGYAPPQTLPVRRGRGVEGGEVWAHPDCPCPSRSGFCIESHQRHGHRHRDGACGGATVLAAVVLPPRTARDAR